MTPRYISASTVKDALRQFFISANHPVPVVTKGFYFVAMATAEPGQSRLGIMDVTEKRIRVTLLPRAE